MAILLGWIRSARVTRYLKLLAIRHFYATAGQTVAFLSILFSKCANHMMNFVYLECRQRLILATTNIFFTSTPSLSLPRVCQDESLDPDRHNLKQRKDRQSVRQIPCSVFLLSKK